MKYVAHVEPNSKVNLHDVDPAEHAGLTADEATAIVQKIGKEFSSLQELMYAAHTHSLLIVLQGRDTSGKDGTIRGLLDHSNVQSCQVYSFKVPTPVEADHDFLWRIHRCTPGKGGTAIFNRSHYEDVLVARVHDLVPKPVWKARYDHINHFEEQLTSSNTILIKFYLHIDKDEQEKRLLAREQDPEKGWKLSVSDWKEREFWKDYTKAYEDALGKCSREDAPWYIVPANHKWFRNLAILNTVVETLRPYKKQWKKNLELESAQALAELQAYRARK
jgi:PPK2 family polyphosphate:nucleotide phosphotransferase